MRHLFIFLFFLISATICAQQQLNYSNAPIGDVLEELENSFNVRFSYNTQIFQNKKIDLLIKASSLETILSQLERDLKVVFEKVDERYYILKYRSDISICGYLKDANDGTPLSGATITNKTQKIGAVSNQAGFFTLEQNRTLDSLNISFLGYKAVSLKVSEVDENECAVYELNFENFKLNEVVVQEYLAAGVTKTKDGSVRISPNASDILLGLSEPDVLQSIQLLPGIESPSETASGLYIRGGSPDQNLILWDGIKMYNSDHFFGMISAFNPYVTDNIKVYRNGAKAEYGDRVSGVIDIETTNKIPEKIKGGLGMNLLHADAYFKIPLSKKLGVVVSGRRSITDVLKTPTFSNFSDKVFQNTAIVANQEVFEPEFSETREDFYFADFNLKLIAELSPTNTLTISNLFTKNKLDYSFQDVEFDFASSDKLAVKNYGSNLNWARKWNPEFNTEAKAYFSEYDFAYAQNNRSSGQDFAVKKTNNIKEFGASFHTYWQLNNNTVLSNGYQFFSNQVSYLLADSNFSESSNQNSPTHAIYSQLNYEKDRAWHLDFGIRIANYVGPKSTFLEPRLYVERLINDNLRLKASAEIKNQAVSQIIEFATFDFGLENQIWALSSEEGLPILKSDQLSAGFLFSKSGWSFDVDAYYKDINGLTSLTRGFESTSFNFSEGKSITKGIDILAKKKVGQYTTWLGYSHSRTNFIFKDLNEGNPFRGNNDIAHSFTWSHFYKWKNLQFSLGWKYRTGIPYTQALGSITDSDGDKVIDFAALNGKTLPDYHRMDFSIVYDFKLSAKQNPINAKLGFSLLNLYGRKNVLRRDYDLFQVSNQNNEENIELRETSKYSLGTTPNFVFRVNF